MVGFAVLGCGRIGRMHARNLSRHPRVELVSVFDVVADSAAETAAELGVEVSPGVEETLANPAVQAVLIATPTDTHVPLITASVKAGKAVLCEKPIDLDLSRARQCWKDIEKLNPLIMIGFNRRFDPTFRSLRDRLHAGEIGKLEVASITSRDPAPPPPAYIEVSGGLFRDMTIHDFDMARFLAGDIVEVSAFGANLIDPQIGGLGDIDTCALTLRSKAGALVQISNSRRCAYGYDQRVELFGTAGMLKAGNHRDTSVEAWSRDRTAASDPIQHFFIERYRAAYDAELSAFVAAVENGSAISPGFSDGLAALELAAAAEESLRSARVVKVASSRETK
jgi:myo-inositol 2-dehydrogenase/D-chiro-inositol 1-dehydrogenase